jgi:hypothetical protein
MRPWALIYRFAARNTWIFAILCLLIIVPPLVNNLDEAQIAQFRKLISKETINSAFGFLFFAILLFITYRFFRFYLNPSESSDADSYEAPSPANTRAQAEEYFSRLGQQLSETVSRLEKRLSEGGVSQPAPELFDTAEEKLRFRERISQAIVSEATSNLQKEIVAQIEAQSKFKDAEKYQGQIKERLYRVVIGLERRANLNLSVGALIGAAGIGLLIYLLYISPPSISTSADRVVLALQYFARVSIVFLIEVFAFFFLKLYSQTLGELRHTHNEITNVEMKSAGLQAAIASADKNSIAHAVQDAVDTERNFVLDKGKTTIDLERYKLDGEESSATLNILKELFLPVVRTAVAKRGIASSEQ